MKLLFYLIFGGSLGTGAFFMISFGQVKGVNTGSRPLTAAPSFKGAAQQNEIGIPGIIFAGKSAVGCDIEKPCGFVFNNRTIYGHAAVRRKCCRIVIIAAAIDDNVL